jgi:hypothetical protein
MTTRFFFEKIELSGVGVWSEYVLTPRNVFERWKKFGRSGIGHHSLATASEVMVAFVLRNHRELTVELAPFIVDQNERRKVKDLYFVNGLHTELNVIDRLDFLDVFLR